MQEIARLRGQIEVLANELANTQKRQKDFYTDLDARLRNLEPRQITIDGQEAAVGVSEQTPTTPPSACSSRATTRPPPLRSMPS